MMTRLQGDREMRGWFMTSLAAGIMVCGSLNAYAEIVTLKSGKRFESPVKEAFGDRVVLDIQGIPVTYYWDEIEDIETSSSAILPSGQDSPAAVMPLVSEFLESIGEVDHRLESWLNGYMTAFEKIKLTGDDKELMRFVLNGSREIENAKQEVIDLDAPGEGRELKISLIAYYESLIYLQSLILKSVLEEAESQDALQAAGMIEKATQDIALKEGRFRKIYDSFFPMNEQAGFRHWQTREFANDLKRLIAETRELNSENRRLLEKARKLVDINRKLERQTAILLKKNMQLQKEFGEAMNILDQLKTKFQAAEYKDYLDRM